jgi:hypothetical protein
MERLMEGERVRRYIQLMARIMASAPRVRSRLSEGGSVCV